MTTISPDLASAIELAKSGGHSMVRCPSHPDNEASLHVAHGTTQPVVMTCHAGCEVDDILSAENIPFTAILAERDERAVSRDDQTWTPAGPASHIYSYTDEQGTELFQVLRIPLPGNNKTFRQRHMDPISRRWVWNMSGVPRVLYRLPDVVKAKDEGRVIWIVEGEKDAETLVALGECATTSPMGAGKWRDEFTEVLAGATVKIIADADATGRAHARTVRDALQATGSLVSVYEARAGAKDISDQIAQGGTLADLVETKPEQEERRESYGVDVLDAVKRSVSAIEFVVPNTLARGDRLLITGFEGHGKSTLLRQIAAQVAAGIHPFGGANFEPKKVLFIDAENHPDQVLVSWQDLVGLVARHDKPMERGQLTILEEWDNDNLDLLADDGADWLIERIHAYKPDLVCMGPLTNMAGRDLKDDETVRKIKKAVNAARSIYGTAFIMEHHAPHKGPMDRERSVRPYGSSMFLKWPDFGYGLKPTETKGLYEWQKTRFPRVRTRLFPEYLRTGKENTDEFPWVPATVDEETGQVY